MTRKGLAGHVLKGSWSSFFFRPNATISMQHPEVLQLFRHLDGTQFRPPCAGVTVTNVIT